MAYYRPLAKLNISVDMVGVKDDLSEYKLVIAPLLYMCKEGFDEKLRTFVQDGGVFVTSYFSGIVDDNDLVVTGGYPGRLRDILGIWVEESDAIPEGSHNSFYYIGKKHRATIICDLLHLEKAQSISRYEADFYRGMPALTLNNFGKGKAYYVATHADELFYEDFLGGICEELDIRTVQRTPVAIEATLRENENGEFLFILNHNDTPEMMSLDRGGTDLLTGKSYRDGEVITMQKKDVMILKCGEKSSMFSLGGKKEKSVEDAEVEETEPKKTMFGETVTEETEPKKTLFEKAEVEEKIEEKIETKDEIKEKDEPEIKEPEKKDVEPEETETEEPVRERPKSEQKISFF
jgi:hypothetical protein